MVLWILVLGNQVKHKIIEKKKKITMPDLRDVGKKIQKKQSVLISYLMDK